MDPRPLAHAFVLRIWFEEAAGPAGSVRWRGHITHVMEKRERTVEDLAQVTEFVEEYINTWSDQPEGEP